MLKPDPTRGAAGNLGAGQSAGGAYANAAGNGHDGRQSQQGYHGGGQAGADNASQDDHHAASRQTAPDDDTKTLEDHPSQHTGPTNDRLHAANAGNPDLAEDAQNPGDRIQGSDGQIVTGKP